MIETQSRNDHHSIFVLGHLPNCFGQSLVQNLPKVSGSGFYFFCTKVRLIQHIFLAEFPLYTLLVCPHKPTRTQDFVLDLLAKGISYSSYTADGDPFCRCQSHSCNTLGKTYLRSNVTMINRSNEWLFSVRVPKVTLDCVALTASGSTRL